MNDPSREANRCFEAQRAKTEGAFKAARAVRSRLDEFVALGYSAAGVALEVGGVRIRPRPRQVVATGGAERPTMLNTRRSPARCARPSPTVCRPQVAAFATVASIALQGLRLAEVGPGAKVAVVGPGLIGQLAVRLARA